MPDMERTDPLQGIDAVPWQQLHAAYGEAHRIPGLLRLLGSSEPIEVEEGWEQVGEQVLWHQGTVYEGTVSAVPFLVRLAERPTTLRRPRLISFLAQLSLAVESDHAPGRAAEVRNAVRAEVRSLTASMGKTDRGSGIAAAELSAALPFDVPDAQRTLGALIESETDPRVRDALTGASVMLGDRTSKNLHTLLRIERESVIRGAKLPGGLTVIPPAGAKSVAGGLVGIPTLPVHSTVRHWIATSAPRRLEDEAFFDAAREVNRVFSEFAGRVVWEAP
jgi:hypothetical protein